MSNKNEKVQGNGVMAKFMSMNKWFYAFLAAAVLFVGAIVAVLIIALGGEEAPVTNDGPLTEGAETGVYYYDAEKGEYLLSINSGNKFTIAGPDLNKSGEYTVAGSEITLDFVKDEDGTAKVTIADNVLTMLWNNTEMRFLKKVSFNVTFQTDGGSAVTALSVLNGKTAAKPADPTKDGYAFIGWYADAACTKAFDFSATAIGADTAVYAKWIKLEPGRTEYTVNFDLGYEGATAPAQTETINGKLYGVEAPTREGYTFAGWWISVYNDGTKLTYECTEDAAITADTTLYALWIDNASTKLAAPAVSVDGSTIKWNAVTGATSYALTITAPNGEVTTKNVGATSEKVDFATLPAGDYVISVSAISSDVNKNSEPAVRCYRNKSLERVSGYTVLDGSLVIWNAVAGAEKYLVTVECGEAGHVHTAFDNGKQTFFNISNCKMQKGGVKITVVAVASGYLDSVATTYVYEKNLSAIGAVTYDEETHSFVWERVENAATYYVLVKCAGHTHTLVDNGNVTSYSVKYCTGAISVEVYPATVGYNSPEATKLEYNKTTLPAPQNIVLKGKNLTWDAVAGATGYQVKIGAQTFPVSGNTYNLDDSGIAFVGGTDYTISVMAVGTASSVYSDVMTTKVFAMTALSYNNKVVSWTPVIGVNGYEISVNGAPSELVADGTSYAVELTKAGVNTIRVRYIGGGDTGWAELEVYAYEVTYDSRSISGVEKEYLAIGDTMSMPTTFELAGYDFAGWYNAPAASANGATYPYAVFSENGDLVLYAAWTPKDYVVKFYGCENVENIVDGSSVTVTYGKSFKLPVPVSKSGDNFSGWYTANGEMIADAEGNSVAPYDVTRDTNAYASFDTGLITYTLRPDGTYAAQAGPNVDSATSITIPATYKGIAVTAVLENGFYDSDSLLTINFPSTIKLIGTGALGSCNILQSINIYEVKTETPYKQVYFSDQGALLYYDEPSDSTYLELFPRGKEGHYEMSDEVDIIRDMAFERTSITSIKIGKGVSYIAKRAFYDCPMMQSIEFATGGDITLTIEPNAFQSCKNVKSLVLPARLTGYTLSQLDNFPALENISIEEGNADYKSVGGMLCDVYGETILYCPTSFAANNGVFKPAASIRTIASNVFAKNKKITEVVIPYYVTTIEANAFKGSTSLAKVTIDSGRSSALNVGASAFADCKSLAEVNLGSAAIAATTEIDEGTITFGDGVFAGCKALRTVNVLGGINIVTLGTNAFKGAEKLSKFNATADVVIAEIGANAFNGTAFASFELHATTTMIGDGAFANCKDMITFTYGAGTTGPKFGSNVFTGCVQLQNIELSATLTAFDIGVFGETVKYLTVAAGNTTYATDGGILYNADYTTVIAYPRGLDGDLSKLRWDTITKIAPNAFKGITKITSVQIGANVTEIGAGAFEGCTKLTSVSFAGASYKDLKLEASAFKGCTGMTEFTLPNGLTSVANYAFSGCSNLVTVNLPEGLVSIGNYAFQGCSKLANISLSAGITSIGDYAFSGCSKLETLVLPDTVKTIGAYAFQNTILKSVNMPKDLESVGAYAFSGTKITTVAMPAGVSIGKGAFKNCKNLYDITFPSDLEVVGEEWFSGCTSLVTVKLPTTVTEIGKSAFYGCTVLMNLTLHEGITTIGVTAFRNVAITSLTIPASVTYIASGAFQAANKITKITFAERTKPLALGAASDTVGVFEGCTSLAGTVVLDKTVTTLGARAFYGCSKLTGIDLANVKVINGNTFRAAGLTSIDLTGVTSIGTYAFYQTKLATVTIPATVPTIAQAAFQNCTSLTSLTISEGVKTIGNSAFYGCTKLNNVEIPTSVTNIQAYAFRNTQKLENLTFTAGGTQPLTIEANALYQTYFTTITFPARLALIGAESDTGTYIFHTVENVFTSNGKLTEIKVATDPAVAEPAYSAYDGILYRNRDNVSGEYAQYATLLYCPRYKAGEATVHSATTLVEDKAFAAVNKLTTLTFESRPETDDTWNVPSLVLGREGSNVVIESSSLTQVTLPAHLKRVGPYAFGLKKVETDKETGEQRGAVTVTFNPNSLFSIGNRAFYATNNGPNPGLKAVYNLRLTDETAGYVFQTAKNLETVTFAPGSTITKFKEQMFRHCAKLTAIEIPASVVEIEKVAFESCIALTSLTFEEGSKLETIGTHAFQGCTGLTEFVMPDNLRWINDGAFSGCYGIKSVTVSPVLTTGIDMNYHSLFASWMGLETINVPEGHRYLADIDGVLYDKNFEVLYCYPRASKAELVLPESLHVIEAQALTGYQGSELKLPSRLEEIKDQACSGMVNLTSLEIPATMKKLGSGAFSNCTSLATITFMPGCQLTEIGANAFSQAAITTISVPDNVGLMGSGVFARCYSLTSVILPAALTEIPSDIFASCGNLTSVTIQSRVTSVAAVAFRDCAIAEITLPDSVLTIGQGAFEACRNLTAVYLSENAKLDKIEPNAFKDLSKLTTFNFTKKLTTIGNNAFEGCTALTTAVLPNSLTTLGTKAFYNCTALENLTLSASLTAIPESAFENCAAITDVQIAATVTAFGKAAFKNCVSLANVTFDPACTITAIGEEVFYGTTSLSAIALPATVISIGESAFRNSGIATLSLPFSLTSLAPNAFRGCENLVELTIPNGLAEISAYAFADCTGLTTLNLYGGLEQIGDFAFSGCTALESVLIPSTVEKFGANPFMNCTALTDFALEENPYFTMYEGVLYNKSMYTLLYYPGGLTAESFEFPEDTHEIEGGAFAGAQLQSIVIPERITVIPESAFENCALLTSVTLNEAVTSIGGSAFKNCVSLNNVVIPASVTSIGDYAFAGCASLTNEGFTVQGSKVAYGTHLFDGCISLTDVLPIGAFNDYMYAGTGIVEVTIPSGDMLFVKAANNGVHYFEGVFANCTKLTTVNWPKDMGGANYLGNAFFAGCTALTEITIPSGLRALGVRDNYGDTGAIGVFAGCVNLETVNLPDDFHEFGDGCFENCVKLATVNLTIRVDDRGNAETQLNAGARAFKNCVLFTNKQIVGAMSRMGNEAFMNCTSLTGTVLFNGPCIEALGARIFAGCMGITNLEFRCRKGVQTGEASPEAFVGMDVENVKVYIADAEGIGYDGLNKTGMLSVFVRENVTVEFAERK